MSTEANQPAFPVLAFDKAGDESYVRGLSKREYFAGLAMQGILANNYYKYSQSEDECEVLARVAANFADALIKELSKP
jgi:hypothetical protein